LLAGRRRLRIAQVAPPVERVPPLAYGGTERIVHELTTELVRRGHEVTTFASGDSEVPGRLVPTIERAMRPAGDGGDASGWFMVTIEALLDRIDQFDLVHSHLEWWSIPLARISPIPVVSTFHGRLDLPWSESLLGRAREGVVAISRSQASAHPQVPWTVIHNGLSLEGAPFKEERSDDLCFVGRVDPEKGIIEAIELAAAIGRRLRIAAKIGTLPDQLSYYEEVFKPALERAGSSVEFLGELAGPDRDRLFADSYATLMPGAWPEPFGLVAIESLACGTPILARRVGGLPEIIRDGVDGFFGDDVAALAFQADRIGTLDRAAIRDRVLEHFSATRMTDRYEELYARMLARRTPARAVVRPPIEVEPSLNVLARPSIARTSAPRPATGRPAAARPQAPRAPATRQPAPRPSRNRATPG
jgi:glycosyltransferase involved in cell wall biosynthesis